MIRRCDFCVSGVCCTPRRLLWLSRSRFLQDECTVPLFLCLFLSFFDFFWSGFFFFSLLGPVMTNFFFLFDSLRCCFSWDVSVFVLVWFTLMGRVARRRRR
ncbi:hypothetical protein ABB37_06379 [Leptomonas pyrrhocoris]|uniref:Transmembrane protein n=1 Tax=Leptomonas pyrrhocoris TaxID=157538 RepID=A0A0N0DTZ9_LEPPY|nr:hypothetical protein ABB37_06379 [Leptomonas pyrrhocoris]KPA78218.1 hypothetical protein ABB37_06379 [Leptomonas pyrrhocoris]|eukprot:XP_015656657.1 hypothetical protein ABB37_06379 [Leptomonas pyrrhocoris]